MRDLDEVVLSGPGLRGPQRRGVCAGQELVDGVGLGTAVGLTRSHRLAALCVAHLFTLHPGHRYDHAILLDIFSQEDESGISLGYGLTAFLTSIYIISLGSWMLTSLAVGFGTAYPNFTEDNPARIAVGLGGTLNFFASAISVLLLLAAEAWPYLVPPHRPTGWMLWGSHLLALAIAANVSFLARRAGERALNRMDF